MWILVLALIGVALFGLIAGYFYNRLPDISITATSRRKLKKEK